MIKPKTHNPKHPKNMQTYYTIELYQSGHWYEWNTVQTLEDAEKLFNEYIKIESIDNVAILHHIGQRILTIKSKAYLDEPAF